VQKLGGGEWNKAFLGSVGALKVPEE